MNHSYATKRRRAHMFSIIALVLSLLSMAVLFLPHKMVKDPNSICAIHIHRLGEQIATEYLDTEQIVKILASVRCRRIYGQSMRFTTEDIIELGFWADGKPMHMVFGKDNYCYRSTGILREYKILDAVTIQTQIIASISQREP